MFLSGDLGITEIRSECRTGYPVLCWLLVLATGLFFNKVDQAESLD
jgi:hypothetical protein